MPLIAGAVKPGAGVLVHLAGDTLAFDLKSALIPMGYMGDPLDIANMNLFLASDESRYITGTEMVVDGGMAAQ